MRKLVKIGLLILVIGGGLVLGGVSVEAEVDCSGKVGEPLYECLGRQIGELQEQLELSKAATAPLEAELNRLESRINSIQAQIRAAEERRENLEAEIAEREEKLALQYVLLRQKLREYYKRMRSNSGLMVLLSEVGTGEVSRDLGYREVAAKQDRKLILAISDEIVALEEDKKQAEESKRQLASLQAQLDEQRDFFEGEIAGAKAYQKSLQSQIAQLSALQESVLSSKTSTFQTTVGDVPLADDPRSRPDFDPGFRPAFAAFSFGAPHFKGMSQYGAFGRAKAGQNAETILRVYYGGGIEIKKDYDSGKQIHVVGCTVGTYSYGECVSKGYSWIDQTVDIETYTKRIYEMPSSWTDNDSAALKAQAVAARSYALARGGTICPSESCQVYKTSNKGGAWDAAVDATRGWVLMANGQPFSAWYASTSGGYQESYTSNGYSTPGFWDAKGGQGGWTSQAYEKLAESPWFYKGWYETRGGDSCGRDHPWLTGEEMADVINAWVVLYERGESDDRVTPIGSCWGGDPYSIEELRSKGGFSQVTGADVTYRSDGITDKVVFDTDKGRKEIPGQEFYKAFNLRAPGRIALKSGLFNIESK